MFSSLFSGLEQEDKSMFRERFSSLSESKKTDFINEVKGATEFSDIEKLTFGLLLGDNDESEDSSLSYISGEQSAAALGDE